MDFFHDFGGQTLVEQRLERFPENNNKNKKMFIAKSFLFLIYFFPKNEKQNLNDLRISWKKTFFFQQYFILYLGDPYLTLFGLTKFLNKISDVPEDPC
jgi:hypothetical protein